MVGVIIGSKRTGINPDNIAAPIAASFGDLITLGLLAIISQRLFFCIGEKKERKWVRLYSVEFSVLFHSHFVLFFKWIISKLNRTRQVSWLKLILKFCSSISLFSFLELYPYVIYVVCVVFLCLTPVWVIISFCHSESHKLLYNGWEPIITAMVISRSVNLDLLPTICNIDLWPYKSCNMFFHWVLMNTNTDHF